jgi:RND superfamily putative drug exporter
MTLSEAPILGPIGRLGRASAHHRKRVAIIWVAIIAGFGVFAPRVETALSGAGWEASGSESVSARHIIDTSFAGATSYAIEVVVHDSQAAATSPSFRHTLAEVEATLGSDRRISNVVAPSPSSGISRDGHTAVVVGGAAGDPTVMVQAAGDLKVTLKRLAGPGQTVSLTGDPGLWSDFNAANRTAMMKSELVSWPVTLAILVLAFGALVAASLPLLLTIAGLVAAAGSLYVASQASEVSIWAMNFALMFALALGIDYALFIVNRFRGALFGSHLTVEEAVGATMDTAGKAVLFSGTTVLISLSAVMLVPSPAFRSMALGIMLAVIFILGAALTLLPAALGKLGPSIDRGALPWAHSGEHRSSLFARWAEVLWRHPVVFGATALAILVALSLPVIGLRTGMPSIKVIPTKSGARVGYDQVTAAFGPGAPGMLQIVGPSASVRATEATLRKNAGIAAITSVTQDEAGALTLIEAMPATGPSDPATGATIDALRATLPSSMLIGGAAAENHDLERALHRSSPIVLATVLILGFVLLLVALQAPLIAVVGVITNLLAVGGAFGVARLIFQDGHGAGILGFEPQGFLDAWGPVFFFAMIFAISMDYTVFLLSSAKEHWDRSHDARDAMVGGVAHSGRVVFAAAAVMVAVFFTFSLSGPLPPKEMGVILGVAVLLDAFLIRLVLLPVALRLLGTTAWALPRALGRLLPKITFGH